MKWKMLVGKRQRREEECLSERKIVKGTDKIGVDN